MDSIDDELNSIKQDIEEYEEFEPYKLDIEVIENQSGKIMDLIKDIDDFSYTLNNRYYSFKFNEPLYIQKIKFSPEEGVSLKGMELVSIDYNDTESTITFFQKNHTIWLPNKVIKEFRIKPPSRLLKRIKLTSIELLGFKLEDLNTVKDNLDDLEEIKSSFESISQSLENKNEELKTAQVIVNQTIKENNEKIDELNGTILKLKEEMSTLTNMKTSLEDEVNKFSLRKESLSSESTNLENNIQQLNETSSQLNTKISNQSDELQKLTEDTNIFATEMKEYIEQGNEDIKLYTWLSLIPWALIALVSVVVFLGASDLTTIFDSKEKIDISSVFWSRIPFVIIVVSILFVSYEISKVFIKNIIHIHKQKRIFTKIGIIAKDVADQSIVGLELEEKEKFELRTKLKMDLLKNHLKKEIGEDYEYKVKTSLLEYLPRFRKKPEVETNNDS